MTSDIEHCEKMIAEQKRRAVEASSPEAAESHHQLIMLYKAQHRVLRNRVPVQTTPR